MAFGWLECKRCCTAAAPPDNDVNFLSVVCTHIATAAMLPQLTNILRSAVIHQPPYRSYALAHRPLIILTNLKSHYCSRMRLIKLHSYLNNAHYRARRRCAESRPDHPPSKGGVKVYPNKWWPFLKKVFMLIT